MKINIKANQDILMKMLILLFEKILNKSNSSTLIK